MNKRNILFVEQHAFMGGGQRIIASLAIHPQIRQAWNVSFALPEQGALAELLHGQGIPVALFPGANIRNGRKSIRDLLAYARSFVVQWRWFRRIILQQRPVYIYTSSPRYVMPILFATLGTSVRVIFHFHHFYDRPTYKIFLRAVLKHPKIAQIICPSVASEVWVRSLLGPVEKLACVPNWLCLNLPSEAPDRHGQDVAQMSVRSTQSFTFAVIGRVVHIKGQDLFLRAAKILLDRGETAEFYVIGGNAFGDDARYVLDLEREYGGIPFIHFLGHIAQISEIYPQISCVVIPSREEVFSMVAIEAMYAGVPVIVSDIAELPRIVDFGRSGKIFASDSVNDLVTAMSQMLHDNEYRLRVAANGRRIVDANYLPHVAINRIVKLLK